MSRHRQLLTAIAVLLALFLLVFLFLRSEGVTPSQHQRIVSHLAALRELDPKIDRRMLQIRHGAILSYDTLVNDMAELVSHATALEEDGIGKLAKKYPELEEERLKLQQALTEKAAQVENFKSYSAVASNSLRFLNSYTHALSTTPKQQKITLLAEQLQRQILLLRLGRADLVSPAMIDKIVLEIQETAGKSGAESSKKALAIVRHAQVIIEAEEDMSKVMAQLLAGGSTLGKAMTTTYNDVFEQELHKANIYRHLLFLYAVALMLGMLYAFLHLRNNAAVLRSALSDLEFQKFALDQHAIVSVTDVRGEIIYVNDRFCSISGFTREELMGKNHRLIKSDQHAPAFYKKLWQTIAKGEVWHGEVCNKSKTGQLYWVSATVVPFLNNKGKPFQYVSIRTDITRQKELEQDSQRSRHFLESITETLGEAIYAEDANGRCTFLNHQAEKVLGWERQELLGHSIHERIHFRKQDGQPLPASECSIGLTVRRNAIFASEEEFFIRKDGTHFPVQVSAVPLLEDARYSGLVAVFQDISKRKQEQAELTEAKNLADQASQAKSMFLANMSHEIRTPMNAIIGLSHLCLDTPLNEEQHDYVHKIHSSGQMLLGILNDILDFSKIEAGKMTLENTPFNLQDLIDQVWVFAIHQTKGRELQLSKSIAESIPLYLQGDPLRLGQVLTNLLGNACKFTEQGSVNLQLDGGPLNDEYVEIRFAVNDTGIGMSEEQLQRLFGAFSQADSSTSRRFGGTGLGLSISQRLVNLMGGELQVSSRQGEGSCFSFSLKLPIATAGELVSQTSTEDVPLAGLRVLLVEDNAINQQIAVRLLSRKHAEVTVATNGQEAVNMLLEAPDPLPWDIVFMDVQMPVMDGYEATRQIRRHARFGNLPIIAMTANAMPEEVKAMFDAGMNAHVPKPVQPALLYNALSTWGKRQNVAFAEDAAAPPAPLANEAALIDKQPAIDRLGGDNELYMALLEMWLSNEKDSPEMLNVLIHDEDWPAAERLAHTIKGTASSLGLVALEQLSHNLEAQLHRGQSPHPSDLERLAEVFRKTQLAVETSL